MPKDEWLRANQKAASRKRGSGGHRKAPWYKKLRHPLTIPARSPVICRQVNSVSTEFKRHVTRLDVKFSHFVAASKKAFLVEHDGWLIWVSKKLLR